MGVYIKMKKKTLSLLLVLTLVMTLVVGCKKKEEKVEEPVTETTEETTTEEVAEDGVIAKMGLGKVTSLSGDDAGEKEAKAQIDVTAAAVGLDAEGKIVSVSIDTVQNKAEFDKDLQLVTEAGEPVKTKKELKEEYDMKKASPIGKEWYEQMDSLEAWMLGKTVDEVLAMELTDGVPAVEDLTSTVTIKVEGYLAAVEEAAANSRDVVGAEKIGLGIKSSLSAKNTRGLKGEETPKVHADVTMSAVAFDKDGKILESIIDTVQGVVEFDAEGKVTTDLKEKVRSKKELKEEYNMLKASKIGKEWHEQMTSFEEWMKGKTTKEVVEIPVKEADENHKHVPDVEDLASTVTITVEGYLEAVEKADQNKK